MLSLAEAFPNLALTWTEAFFLSEGVASYDIYRIDALTLDGTANFIDTPTPGELLLYAVVDPDTFTYTDTEPPSYLTTQYAYLVRATGDSAGALNSNVEVSQAVS